MQTNRIAALAVILAAGLTAQGGAQDYQGYISGGGDTFATNPGIPVVIYGHRGECQGKEAPTFAALMESKGVTQAPRHGTISDGGTGKRLSKSCGKAVPVRVVIYTADPNFVGEDSVEFWGTDISTITVAARCPAAAMAQTSSSTLSIEAGAVPDQAPAQLDDGWEVAAPSQGGFDPAALAALTEAIESNDIRNVHAVIVERAGRLVYEQYFSGPDERWGHSVGDISFDCNSVHDLRSVTKSVTSALLGIALDGDYQNAIEQPVIEYFEDLEGKFGAGVENVTLRHVLTMTAGLEWNEMKVPYTNPMNDERRLNDTPDPVSMVLGRPVRDPVGSQWYYNGGLTQVLAGLIQRMTGKRLDTFAEETLFGPLGITNYEWLASRAWSSEDSPSAASGLRMRARDLAKFGSLFLHEGVWKDQQVIPEEWVHLSTQRHVQNIPWSPDGTYGYGFMWYPGQTRGSEGYRIIRAAGNGDQRIFIVPEKEIVVTVFAGNYNKYYYQSGEKVFAKVMDARLRSN